jgi:hypothetical protein
VVKQACQRAAFTVILIERTKEGAMMKKLKKAAGPQETSTGSKKRISARHELRVTLGAVVSFLVATFLLGYYLGWNRSQRWDDTSFVRDFMREHLSAKFLAASRQSLPESDPIELRLPVDDRQFTYRTDIPEKIAEDPLSDRDPQARQQKDYHESVIQGGRS